MLNWTYDDIEAFGTRPHRASHSLLDSGLFSDDALADLLDRVPRSIVHPYSMGTDPALTHEWQRGRETSLPGRELLDTVAQGRLWLNVVGVGDHDPAIASLVRELYDEISTLVPGFDPLHVKATLLISSPNAQVYYHADNQPNALWHLRGRKRALVYPIAPRFVSDEDLERLVAGATDEQLPYQRSYDDAAAVLDLEPGQVAWWPQNSPHRVENVEGLNVSLSTEHRTNASTHREHVWTANYFLRSAGYQPRSVAHDGVRTATKIAAMRVGRRAGRLRVSGHDGPAPSFEIDPAAPLGRRDLV